MTRPVDPPVGTPLDLEPIKGRLEVHYGGSELWSDYDELKDIAALVAEVERLRDECVNQRVIGHGEGQEHTIADVNAGRIDDLIAPRLRASSTAPVTKREYESLLNSWRAQDDALQEIVGLCAEDATITCPADVVGVVERALASTPSGGALARAQFRHEMRGHLSNLPSSYAKQQAQATIDAFLETLGAPSGGAHKLGDRCPRCDSPAPHLHPAVQFEGEVQPCPDAFHSLDTPQNRPYLKSAAPSGGAEPAKPSCCRITDPCSEACVDDWLAWEAVQERASSSVDRRALRLVELAHAEALRVHSEATNHGWRASNGHTYGDWQKCPHPDCVLVRSDPSPSVPREPFQDYEIDLVCQVLNRFPCSDGFITRVRRALSQPSPGVPREPLEVLARELVARYMDGGGCGWCGGLPHTTTCLVGRVQHALASSSSPVSGAEPWQPIETAPKDGTRFVGRDTTGCIAEGYYNDGAVRRVGVAYYTYFTHWMPLPAPPEPS